MPFVFILLGVGLLIVAIKGTHVQFFQLLKSEFTGSNNFLVWVLAIAILGALGFIKPIRPIALGFMVLVFLVMILKNGGGFFSQLNSQIANPTAPSSSGGTGLLGTFGTVTTQTPFGALPQQTVTTPSGTYTLPEAQTPWAPGSF